MKVFVLFDDLSQLVTEIFELSTSILPFNALSLQGLNLPILILDDIVESFDLSGSHLEFKLVLIDPDGSLSKFCYFFLEYLVLAPHIFELSTLSVK